MRRNTGWGRLAMLAAGRREAPHGYDFATNVMHVDTDAICPKCLRWVTPNDIVRRNAYGLVQHEACAVVAPTEISTGHL
jgi:D-lyxose ketol-isomerase